MTELEHAGAYDSFNASPSFDDQATTRDPRSLGPHRFADLEELDEALQP